MKVGTHCIDGVMVFQWLLVINSSGLFSGLHEVCEVRMGAWEHCCSPGAL